MPDVWYAIVVALLTGYVVLDGFDLGAGALHPFVAKGDAEKRQLLAAIGPYWDGNEVWLLAGGGALFVGFPRVLAVGVSGFYFAIFLVIWCLILRGISIEFRSHVSDSVWRGSWDVFFFAASALLPVFFGAALGNLLRGVSLKGDGWFELPLFTDFTARPPVGILDWYTILVGVFALAALCAHGAAFLVWKTDGALQARSRAAGRRLAIAAAVLWPAVTLGTARVNREFLPALARRPLALALGATALAGLVALFAGLARGRDRAAFLGSCVFLAGLSAATAAAVYPVMLRSAEDAALSMTVQSAAGDPSGLRVALAWFAIGFPLALAYLAALFRMHRGKAAAAAEGEGY
jgi:cytochrome d ubiquinol oxidase subunit II